jgi:uncharacterized protein (DUF488 family)
MIATIGYEKSALADFIQTLVASDIEVLVDIRDRAQSRIAGFSKSALSEALATQGIGYIHYKQLGDPKEGREAARSGNITLFKEIFNNVMQSEQALQALNEISSLVKEKSICLLCYERDQRFCHRKIVADELQKMTGIKPRHLGVQKFEHGPRTTRRVLYSNQSAAA